MLFISYTVHTPVNFSGHMKTNAGHCPSREPQCDAFDAGNCPESSPGLLGNAAEVAGSDAEACCQPPTKPKCKTKDGSTEFFGLIQVNSPLPKKSPIS